MSAVPVLMYHGVHVDERSRGRFDPVYSVSPKSFAMQLDALKGAGYTTVLLDELATLDHNARPVVVTFDDGDVSNLEVALPLLAERGMRAEFFVTSDFVGTAGMLSEAGVRALADAGMGIGSHGRTHRFLEDLAEDDMAAELRDSRDRLAQCCGRAIDSIALPGGRGGERERRAAQSLGYRHLLGSVPGQSRASLSGWMRRWAVTRGMGDEDVMQRVAGSGLAPRLAVARYHLLQVPKRVLGNAGYERLRARLL